MRAPKNAKAQPRVPDRPNEAYTLSRRITLCALGVTLKEPAVNTAPELHSRS